MRRTPPLCGQAGICCRLSHKMLLEGRGLRSLLTDPVSLLSIQRRACFLLVRGFEQFDRGFRGFFFHATYSFGQPGFAAVGQYTTCL